MVCRRFRLAVFARDCKGQGARDHRIHCPARVRRGGGPAARYVDSGIASGRRGASVSQSKRDAARPASSLVETDDDALADRMALARQHKTVADLLGFERVVLIHLYLALEHLRPARAAYAALAR